MTLKRVSFLKEMLEFVGLGGRLHLEWISSAEAQKFVQVITSFTEQIKFMGPNPLTGFDEKFREMMIKLSGPPVGSETVLRAKTIKLQSPVLH